VADGDVVANVDVVRHYAITESLLDGQGTVYYWYDDRGDHSDEWFESIEEAIRDAKNQ
jgi:hypothetical protein